MEESRFRFTSDRIIDGKRRTVIVDKTGKIINNNPSKEELKSLKKEPYKIKRRRTKYNDTNTCIRCRDEGRITKRSLLYPGNACQEKDKDGNETGEWVCKNHWGKYYYRYDPNSTGNAKKSVRNCRTGNQSPNSSHAKGDKSQELACEIYGWEDLNKKNDNYNSSIDCYDHKTGLYHQVKGKWYDFENRYWKFGNLRREWYKKFEDMICFCISEDGKMVEMIYRFPSNVIKRTTCITIYNSENEHWYDGYRIKDEDELKRANEIWKKIL